MRLGEISNIYLSDQVPDDADTAGPEPHFETHHKGRKSELGARDLDLSKK